MAFVELTATSRQGTDQHAVSPTAVQDKPILLDSICK